MIARAHVTTRGLQPGNVRTRASVGHCDNLHRAIMFLSVAGLLLVVGCILLGIGSPHLPSAHMTGPILIALSLLLVAFAIREYFLARQSRIQMRRVQFNTTGVGALAALTVTSNDRLGAITLVMDTRMPADFSEADLDFSPPPYSQLTLTDHSATSNVVFPSTSHQQHISYIDQPPSYYEAVKEKVWIDPFSQSKGSQVFCLPCESSPHIDCSSNYQTTDIVRPSSAISLNDEQTPVQSHTDVMILDNNNFDSNNNTELDHNNSSI